MTTPPATPVSAEARGRGRDRALAARRDRARIKENLRNGRMVAEDVIRLATVDSDLGTAAARMRIGDLLLSVPGIGPATADRMLVAAGISGQRRISGLGPRQLERIRELLR